MNTVIEPAFRVTVAAILLVIACGVSPVKAGEPTAEEVAVVIAQAREELAQARSLGHGWSVTPTYIQEAEAALAANQLAAAFAAAERANLTAMQAVRQAELESSSWRDRVPSS
ncbi:MAG: hypothetical protein ABJK25_18320 [Halieaceae bacterium]